jgi:hypothetical protein
MEKHLLKLMALAFLAVALTGVALAESNTHVVRANIPFDFYAGGQLHPAGEYTISINDESDMVMIGAQAAGSRSLLLGIHEDASRDERTVLTFKLVGGNVYALRKLESPDLGLSFNGRVPQPSVSAQSQAPESVTIVAQAR